MDDKGKELLKNTIIYAIGNLGARILSFIMVPLYSFFLNKEQFGYYDIVITSITLLVPLITLQLSDSVFRWLLDIEGDESRIKAVITNSYSIVFFNIIFTTLIIGLISSYLKISWLLLLLLLISSSIYPMLQLSIRGLKRNKLYALSGIIFSIVLLFSNVILLVIFKLSVQALFISTILSNVVASLFIVLKVNLFRFFDWKTFSFKKVKELLRYSCPLIPNTISWWLISSANKFIILAFLGIEANGIYGVANRFPAIMLMIDSILIMAWQESAIQNYHKNDRDVFFSKVFNKMIITQLSVALLLALSSRFIIEILISKDFIESWRYMPFLFLGVAFSTFSGFYGTTYLSVKNTKRAFFTSFLAGLLNVLIGFSLVRICGLYGIALGTLAGFMFLYIIRMIDSKKYLKISISVKPLIGFGILFICTFFALYVFENRIVTFILFIISLLFVYHLNRETLFAIIKTIQNKLFFKKNESK